MILKDATPKLCHFTNSLVLFLVSIVFHYMVTYQKLKKIVERSIRWKARFSRKIIGFYPQELQRNVVLEDSEWRGYLPDKSMHFLSFQGKGCKQRRRHGVGELRNWY